MILNYYSTIGILALLILLIENQDILLNLNESFSVRAWKVYRKYLFVIIVYYLTDITWGILESYKLSALLFADTTVYFIAMAAGVMYWTKYTVTYLEEERYLFGRFLLHSGRIFALCVTILSVVNLFTPVLFTVDQDCAYKALNIRYVILGIQILLLLLISAYTFTSIARKRHAAGKWKKYRTLGLFGLLMAAFLTAQLWYPYLPLYAIACGLLSSGMKRKNTEPCCRKRTEGWNSAWLRSGRWKSIPPLRGSVRWAVNTYRSTSLIRKRSIIMNTAPIPRISPSDCRRKARTFLT